MGLIIKKVENLEVVADFVASAIWEHLKSGEKVLFFMTGGSSIDVCVRIAEILKNNLAKNSQNLAQNLTITLTDERYGKVGHTDSNWQQLLEKGFDFENAKLVPVLSGREIEETVLEFNKILNAEFIEKEYKIGLFGIGLDGHTAGILPESKAVSFADWACSYDTPQFSRITITPQAIEKLDEAIIFTKGADKIKVLENLKEEIEIKKQPAQILKKVPLLTIFNL